MRSFNALLIGLAATSAAAVAAPPKLVDSTPAADGIATKPAKVELGFDQAVVAEGATFDVLMMTMPGMKMNEPMRMTVASTSVDASGKLLTAAFKMPLPAGTYDFKYQVKNAGGETGSGVVSFGVR